MSVSHRKICPFLTEYQCQISRQTFLSVHDIACKEAFWCVCEVNLVCVKVIDFELLAGADLDGRVTLATQNKNTKTNVSRFTL